MEKIYFLTAFQKSEIQGVHLPGPVIFLGWCSASQEETKESMWDLGVGRSQGGKRGAKSQVVVGNLQKSLKIT